MSDVNPFLTYISGGAASGKSAYAEGLTQGLSPRVYIATAEARDGEMQAKIDRHRRDRGAGWETVEAPLDLAMALREAPSGHLVLVDCLTMWLSNLMAAERDISTEIEGLLAALRDRKDPTICVSNELGMGLVPMDPLSREFRNHQGRLNREVAATAGRAVFVVSGLPILLKGERP